VEKIKLGIIGCGTHATNILYPSLAYLDLPIERSAVCDLREDLAKQTAGQYGFKIAYKDYKEMLRKERLDGVMVVINAKTHPPVVIDCLENGVDVLVEKPPAVTVDDAKRMLQVSQKTGRFVMIDHQKRYNTAYRKAMDITREKDFGDIAMIESKMHGRPYDTMFDCLMEWNIHNIDIVRAFGGEIKTIRAIRKQITAERGAIAILLQFDSGAVGTLNWGTEGGFGRFCESLEVVGSNQCGVIVENARKLTYYRGNDAKSWAPDWQPIRVYQTIVLDGYVGVLTRFLECIAKGETPIPNISDGVKNLEAVYEVADQLGIPKRWTQVVGPFLER
jgi:UDP-N-acetylglucosamine 3-dehydrogenase